MPIMPRTNKKATKITFNILGTPSNMIKSRRKKTQNSPEVKTDAKYEELSRIINR